MHTWKEFYRLAQIADDEFTAAIKAEYGANADRWTYNPASYKGAVKKAYQAKLIADERLMLCMRGGLSA